jgi:predicted CXXCH cytochrome family protein
MSGFMKILFAPVTLVAAVLLFPLNLLADNCLDCHSGWEEAVDAPSKLIQRDVHFKVGLGCSDCHGGNPNLDDMDDVRKSKGYKGVPDVKEIPQFCSSCHSDPTYMVKHNPSLATDQLEKYKTSIHGKRLFEKGDVKVANCVSCHSVHDIQSPEIPTSTVNVQNIPGTCAKCHAKADYMKEYGIPTDQYDGYIKSVHGQALLVKKETGAPACNSCHGNHGATPPGVNSLSAVCGLCHALIADNFAKSPHKAAFDAAGYPECETCHSNHNIEQPELFWVGTSDSSLCIRCHAADDGNRGFAVAAAMYNMMSKMNEIYGKALSEIDEADRKGMMVTDERFTLNEVKQAIIQTATEFHALDTIVVAGTALTGIASSEKIYEAGQAKIDDYYFRRKGLGIATLLITILAFALYLKIRSIEK